MEGSFSIEFMILFPSSIIISSNFKYGFCKNGDKCNRSHLKEVCLKRECDSRKCDNQPTTHNVDTRDPTGSKKSRKMSIIREKYKLHCDKLEDEYQKNEIKSEIYRMAINGLTHYLEIPVEESDKDEYLKCIFKCRALIQS